MKYFYLSVSPPCPLLSYIQLQTRESELLDVRQELAEVQERLVSNEESWSDKERQLGAQKQNLEERLEELTKQNNMLHAETEKVAIDWWPADY